MSSTQLSSEEIAEDYKSSLEDLHFNSRYEISNLTVIAKENIHAAQAIARSIEEHINKVSLPNFPCIGRAGLYCIPICWGVFVLHWVWFEMTRLIVFFLLAIILEIFLCMIFCK